MYVSGFFNAIWPAGFAPMEQMIPPTEQTIPPSEQNFALTQ